MKVLYLSHADDTFGAPRSLVKMIEILKNQHKIEPIVITGKKNKINLVCTELGIENYSIRFVNIGRYAKNKNLEFYIRGFISKFVNSIAVMRLNFLLKKIDIDIIHSNVSVIDVGMRISKKSNKPHVWHLREILDENNKWYYYSHLKYQHMDLNTSSFIAISSAVKRFWMDKGISANKISIVYNGISLKNPPQFKLQNEEKIKFVIVGSILPRKGQLDVIEAFALINPGLLANYHLDIIGEGNSEYTNMIRNRIRELNLVQNVSILGFEDDVPSVLKNYDVGIVASKAEAFGRTTIEYMLSGLIVVAANSGASPELIQDGQNGFLYQSNSIVNLKNRLEFVGTNLKNLNGVKKNAYNIAKEKFSSEKNASEVNKVYTSLLRKSQRFNDNEQ